MQVDLTQKGTPGCEQPKQDAPWEIRVDFEPFPHLLGYVREVANLARETADGAFRLEDWRLQSAFFKSPGYRDNHGSEQWIHADGLIGLSGAATFCSKDFLEHTRQVISHSFRVPLCDKAQVHLQMVRSGQRINVHNDAPIFGSETHRVLFYLSETGGDYSGGNLVLYRRNGAAFEERRYAPTAGTVFAFEASKGSFHAVTPVSTGQRLLVQVYLWHVGSSPAYRKFLEGEVEEALREANADQATVTAAQTLKLLSPSTERTEGLIREGLVLAGLLRRWKMEPACCRAGLLFPAYRAAVDMLSAPGAEYMAPLLRPEGFETAESTILSRLTAAKQAEDLLIKDGPSSVLQRQVYAIWWADRLANKIGALFCPIEWSEEALLLAKNGAPALDLEQTLRPHYRL